MTPGGQPPTGSWGLGTKPGFGAWVELLITAGARLCAPLGALPTQAAEDGGLCSCGKMQWLFNGRGPPSFI